MTVTYRTGYGTTRRTLDQLKAWAQLANVHPEMQRRLIALLDDARAAGIDLGIGGGFRSEADQFALFDSRHNPIATGGCCSHGNQRWALVSGAHAAPPGSSYHEETVSFNGRRWGVAVDMVGWENGWMNQTGRLEKYGLRSFVNLSGAMFEPWHLQPVEVPTGRSSYNPTMHTLKTWALPTPTKPPTVIDVPTPTLRSGSTGTEVKELQMACKFWGWYPHLIDGSFGARTADAVRRMQATLKLTQDGVYGSVTSEAYRKWLTALANT